MASSTTQPAATPFNADVVLAFVIGGILFILLFPLYPALLDVLLVLNIAAAVLLLLLMFYLNTPLELSSFPSLLLVMTLFRLSLNVASTKLILLDGKAGSVIDAFGRFVVGNNYVVGAVVFLILIVIQFLVITKGAGRIAEVAARFTLDAMPGKQMSIDADLNAGIIDEHEARDRRRMITEEAEFYGAMDGASKFVKGDAVAGLVITAVNILGGLAIGIFQQNLPVMDALETYTVLTIGDGLVSQIPALVISVASGILITKTASASFLGQHLQHQLLRRPQPFYLCGVMLIVLGIVPGLPVVPFLLLGSISLVIGRRLAARPPGEHVGSGVARPRGELPAGESGAQSDSGATERRQQAQPRPMAIEIGFGLVPLVDSQQGGGLVDRIGMIRKQIRDEYGFFMPPVAIQDNIEQENTEYRVLLRGLERARGNVYMGSLLAIDAGDALEQIEGVRVTDPAFGYDASWISPSRADAAEAKGYTVVDPETVIATHLTKIIREHADELLSRQEVSDMLDKLKETHAAVVSELVPDLLPLAVVHRVLQHLLREQVPIHDLPVILETLTDFAAQSKDPSVLGEFCRQALAGHLNAGLIDTAGTLHAITLAPELEDEMQNHLQQGIGIGTLVMPPERAAAICHAIKRCYERHAPKLEVGPVLLTSPLIRCHLQRLLSRQTPELHILSYGEVLDDVPLSVHEAVTAQPELVPA